MKKLLSIYFSFAIAIGFSMDLCYAQTDSSNNVTIPIPSLLMPNSLPVWRQPSPESGYIINKSQTVDSSRSLNNYPVIKNTPGSLKAIFGNTYARSNTLYDTGDSNGGIIGLILGVALGAPALLGGGFLSFAISRPNSIASANTDFNPVNLKHTNSQSVSPEPYINFVRGEEVQYTFLLKNTKEIIQFKTGKFFIKIPPQFDYIPGTAMINNVACSDNKDSDPFYYIKGTSIVEVNFNNIDFFEDLSISFKTKALSSKVKENDTISLVKLINVDGTRETDWSPLSLLVKNKLPLQSEAFH